jgi:UDP-2-acetamido-3-amino-2,3-dideoxy-glucuronate N-acetyltransferase
VAVATPAENHAETVTRALEAGKDVFVEKPICLSLADGHRIAKLAKTRGRIVMVGHLLWYHPAVVALAELLQRGELGRLQYIYSIRANLGKIRREENILWSFAPHDISVILGLVGQMPSEVDAFGGYFLHPRIADTSLTVLGFPGGVKAHIFVSWLHPIKEQRLIVVGDRQMAIFDDTLPENKLMLYPHTIEWHQTTPVALKGAGRPVDLPVQEPLQVECQHFLDCVRLRTMPRTDVEEGLRVLEVLSRSQEQLGRREGQVGQGSEATEPRLRSSVPAGVKVHESSYIDEDVELGAGTNIWHFSHILSGCRIGRDCRIGQNVVIGPRVRVGDRVKIQNNVSVYEGVTLEEDVFVGPSAVFTNVFNPRSEIPRMEELKHTLVKRGATLGANSTVVCGVEIGEYAFIAAGAVVTRDILPYELVRGCPAKHGGWMCRCAEGRLQFQSQRASCPQCGQSYTQQGGIVFPITG